MKIENHASGLRDQLIRSLTPDNKPQTATHSNLEAELQGESSSLIEGAKLIKENGYVLDSDALKKLRSYLESEGSDTESKLSALKIALQKDLPLKESLLSRIEQNTRLSLMDFLPEQHPPQTNERRNKKNLSAPAQKSISYEAVERSEKLLTKLFSIVERATEKDGGPGLSEREHPDSLLVFGPEKNKRTAEPGQDAPSTLSKDGARATGEAQGLQELISEPGTLDAELLSILEQAFGLQGDIAPDARYTQVLELRVTEKLIGLKEEFRSLKSELSLSMNKVNDESSGLSRSEKLQLLSKMVDKLDSAIMKSELSLYMSLKGERDLLKISSELQIARKHLEQGALNKAEAVLKQSKANLDSMVFEPTLKKAFAVLGSKESREEGRSDGYETRIHESMDRFTSSEKTASSLMAYLRKLGMNHEAEQFQQTQSQKESLKSLDAKNLHTLKESLLKLTESESPSKDTNKAAKLLHYIEGGQLKNKISEEKALQTLELELPIKFDGRIQNVKVFIKSPQNMLKLDWENFDLFFVLNSENLGKLGIKVSAVQRQISVKVINDKSDRLRAEQRIDDNLKEDLEQLGYRLLRVLVEAWKTDTEQPGTESKAFSAHTLDAVNAGIGENNSSKSKTIDIKI